MGGATEVGSGETVSAAVTSQLAPDVTLTGRVRTLTIEGDLARQEAASNAASARRNWVVTLTALTFAVDMVAIAAAYVVAKALHANIWDGNGAGLHLGAGIFATIAVWPAVFAMYGLYDLRRPTHVTAELRSLFHAEAICVLLVVLISFGARIDLSRSFIAALIVGCLLFTVIGRVLTRRAAHWLNCRALTSQATIIVGGNDEARALARTLRRRAWMGFDVRGFVDISPSGREVIDGLPVLGTVDDVAAIVEQNAVGAVIVAGSAAGGATLQRIDTLLPTEVAVRVSPGLPNLGAARVVVEPIDGMALFSLRRHRFSRRQRLLKRCLDVVAASAMLVVAAPFMAVIAVLVRRSSDGPVLFRQRRIGSDGREFEMYKFRSMYVDAEARLAQLRAANEADGLLFKMREDPRVTGVGRFLRRSSLDELPQLLNVLRGDMSLVGPRPALPDEVERYDEQWRGRLRVKPGLTGLWQINGRHDLVFEDYIRYDLFYVENWSVTMDLYILTKTIPALLTARGSY